MAAKGEVKLIGSKVSPFVVRAMIALNLKGIDYEFIHEEFGKKSDLLLKSNPVHKKVPVLIHSGKPVCESLIIVQYIDEVWPASGPSVLPADSHERAVARFWAAFVDDKLPPHIRVLLLELDEQKKTEAKEQLFSALLYLEEAFISKCSKGKIFFGGDTIGLVDIALGSFISLLKAMEKIADAKFFDEERTPQLVEWSEHFGSAVAKEVVPGVEELVEILKVYTTRNAATSAPN